VGKPKKDKDAPPDPDLIVELGDEILKKVKETARKIGERVKKATGDTGEVAKLDTEQNPALKPPPPDEPGKA
jgi:hypothetical protein